MVLYHSMCIHTGNWKLLEGMRVIPAYTEIGRVAYSFMLECFVLVSGYVWAFQRETRGRKEDFLLLCKKKAMRLVVPYLLFGVLYMLLFSWREFNILGIIEGSSHLWFLLMLFWCFLIGWCILQFKLPPKIVLPVLFLISLVRPVGLPLRLSQTLYYLPFFFLGYYIYGYYDWLREKVRGWHLAVSWGLYVVAYVISLILPRFISIGWRGGAILHSYVCNFRGNGSAINSNFYNKQKNIERMVCEGRKPVHGCVYISTVCLASHLLSYYTPSAGTRLVVTLDRIQLSPNAFISSYLCD